MEHLGRLGADLGETLTVRVGEASFRFEPQTDLRHYGQTLGLIYRFRWVSAGDTS